jgi:hypothetical protein
MNEIIKKETAIVCLGVDARAFGVVADTTTGRILNQKIGATRRYKEGANNYHITVELRFDDQCKNDHETFTITADIRENGREYMGGCCHDEIAQHFPEFAPLIKWHLTSTDGPIHYVANTIYHADEHGPNKAWIYFNAPADPLGLQDAKEKLLCYCDADKAHEAESTPGYRVQWDAKTAKVANFDHARSAAVWPDATIEQLRDKAALEARLPGLLAEFKAAMLSAGFLWPEVQP